MKLSKLILSAFAGALFLTSCAEDDNNITPYIPIGTYDSGAIVLNQGGFGDNTTLSYISFDINTVQNNIFGVVNPTLPALGELGQDIGLNGDSAYVTISNNNEVRILNRYTMSNIGSITAGLNHPRYTAFANNKLYVTNQANFGDLTDDFVSVYNLSTNAFVTSIPVPGGSAEKMIVNGSKLYVAQGGQYGEGNKLVTINTSSDSISGSITVGESPNSLQIDNGFLWVLCGGNSSYFPTPSIPIAGKLLKIDLSNDLIVQTNTFPNASSYPNDFSIYGNKGFYHIGNDVYRLVLTEGSLPSGPVFSATAQTPNAFAVKANHIYIADATDFDSDGKVYIYSAGEITESPVIGTLQNTHTVGIAPAGFYFNQ